MTGSSNKPIRDPAICAVAFHADAGPGASAALPPAVAAAYDVVRDARGRVSPMYQAMSGTPGVVGPAHHLYLAVLHDDACPLAQWRRELIATAAARLAGSAYSATHHGANFRDFFVAAGAGDATAADDVLAALDSPDDPSSALARLDGLDGATRAMLAYTTKLSLDPAACGPADLDALRRAGLDDGAISWLIQIVSAFAYFARMLQGLDVQLGNEPIGLKGWAEEA
ncbi:MAG: hypothetical protein RIE31_08295 [Alphaproteobacteria bacterium]